MLKESITLPQKEKKFEVLTGKKHEQSLPTLHSNELDEICNLDISDEEMNRVYFGITQLEQKRPGTVETLAYLLAERNVSSELPIKGETFVYKRNISECKKLKMDAMKLIDAATNNKDAKTGEVTITEDHVVSLLRFLVIEDRKAEWLEREYYPVLFGEAVEVARAEVRQFMVKKKNLGKADSMPDLNKVSVKLMDDLSYVYRGHSLSSAGDYSPATNRISLRILPEYSPHDQWKVYLTAVHEFVHAASRARGHAIGIEIAGQGKLNKLNEAITQFITYFIAMDHLNKIKTPLSGQHDKKNLQVSNMGYAEYMVVVRQIFSKIPSELFVDAMFSTEGLEKLEKEFIKVLGNKDTIIQYGENLENLYNPKSMRVKK